jgi:cytochrome c oxidase subunit 2
MRREIGEPLALAAVAVLLLAATVWVFAADSPAGRTAATAQLDPPPAPPADPLSPDRDPVERGQALFVTKGCVGCHSTTEIAATVPVGPDLTRLPATAKDRVPGLSAEAYVRQSLLEPQAFIVPDYRHPGLIGQMPRLPLNEEEVAALVAYLLSDQDGATVSRP